MNDFSYTELLNMYKEFLDAVELLHNSLPEFQNMSNMLSQKYSEKDVLLDNVIKEIRSKSKEITTEANNDMDNLLSKITTAANQVSSSIQKAETLKESFTEITLNAEKTIKKYEKILEEFIYFENRIEALENKVAALNSGSNPFLPAIDEDYNEELNGEEMFKKYYGKIGRPLIVSSSRWTNKTCFVIDGLRDGYVYGTRFKNGLSEAETKYPSNGRTHMFKLYNGEFIEPICDYYKNL